MTVSFPKLHRLATATGFVAVLATLAIPVAFAGGTPNVLVEGRSPDTLDAVPQTQGLDPAIATAIAAHQYSPTFVDGRSPDTVDAVTRTQGLDPAIARAIAAHANVQVGPAPDEGSGFDPGTFGVALAAVGMTLLLVIAGWRLASTHLGRGKAAGSVSAV